MTKYTEEVQKVFLSVPCPTPGFVVDIVEFPHYLILRVYRPNVDKFKITEKVQIATYLYELRDAIRALGVTCQIEGADNEPPVRERIAQARERLLRNRETDSESAKSSGLLLPDNL